MLLNILVLAQLLSLWCYLSIPLLRWIVALVLICAILRIFRGAVKAGVSKKGNAAGQLKTSKLVELEDVEVEVGS